MTRSIFGWSLPPGVTDRMIDEAYGAEQPDEIARRSVNAGFEHTCDHCGGKINKGQEHLYLVLKDVEGFFFTQRIHRYCPPELEEYSPDV